MLRMVYLSFIKIFIQTIASLTACGAAFTFVNTPLDVGMRKVPDNKNIFSTPRSLAFIQGNSENEDLYSKEFSSTVPYFDHNETTTNVTAQLGSEIFLDCRVKNLNRKYVSWLRRIGEDLHILTVGMETYSRDERFSVDSSSLNNWRLRLKYAQLTDSGTYQCQVSTHPPIIHLVHLNIVVPKVDIVDERGKIVSEKYYKTGSTLELQCVVSQVPIPSRNHPQQFVTWKLYDRMLNHDRARGGISVKTSLNGEETLSRLFIANAQQKDSGNYSCSVGQVAKAEVVVHVLNGEHRAAMQHGSSSRPKALYIYLGTISVLIFHASSVLVYR